MTASVSVNTRIRFMSSMLALLFLQLSAHAQQELCRWQWQHPFRLDVSPLPAGMYLLTITGHGTRETLKFVKE